MKAKVAIVIAAVLAAIALAAQTRGAEAFIVPIHRQITFSGLLEPGESTTPFLRRAVLEDIDDEHAQVDSVPSIAWDERHFDDCEFDGGVEFIRDRYADAREALADLRPWDATDEFGTLLHPAMDLYAHSNWVEMGFPRTTDNPNTASVEVRLSDLIDISGARSSLARPWSIPAGGDPAAGWRLRGDILLGNDDWNVPPGWSVDADGGGFHVPTLIDGRGRTRGRILVTGEGKLDNECDIHWYGKAVRVYDGLEHSVLNKDGPGGNTTQARAHAKARALATLQTSYEWCRLVRDAALVARAGFVLATWVRPGGNPHPRGTPCAADGPGPTPIIVTIESVRILDSGDDDDNDPGEIQLGLALYDDPLNFRRSVHATNRGGVVPLDDGELMPTSRLPAPMVLCVPEGRGASFALYGWDNDDSPNDIFASDFDDKGDDDELLVGFQRRFDARLPTGTQSVRSSDLEVRYRITHEEDRIVACPSPNAPSPR